MNFPVARIVALAALCLALVAGAPRKIAVEIFVVTDQGADINQATVTVSYAGGTRSADVGGPNPHVRFDLPATAEYVDETIEAPGYCPNPFAERELLDGKARVGGHAIWVALAPCRPTLLAPLTDG